MGFEGLRAEPSLENVRPRSRPLRHCRSHACSLGLPPVTRSRSCAEIELRSKRSAIILLAHSAERALASQLSAGVVSDRTGESRGGILLFIPINVGVWRLRWQPCFANVACRCGNSSYRSNTGPCEFIDFDRSLKPTGETRLIFLLSGDFAGRHVNKNNNMENKKKTRRKVNRCYILLDF